MRHRDDETLETSAQRVPDSASGDAVRCPVCAGATFPYCTKRHFDEDWHVRRCEPCGHGFVSNRPSLDRLKAIYSTDAHQPMTVPTPEGYAQRDDAKQLARDAGTYAKAPGRSLDVGSGDGAFSYHLARAGFRPLMIDLDPRAQDAARIVPDAQFQLTSLEELPDEGPFNAIVMSQVLEHALDPIDWLRQAHRRLAPQGVLAVGVPNFGGVYRMLGSRDPFIIPPIHLNFFTPRSITLAFAAAGLTQVGRRSISTIPVDHPNRRFSLKRRVLGRTWNLLSPLVDLTSRGIIMWAFGRRQNAAGP